MTTRKPAVAGMFYPGQKEELRAMIEDFLSDIPEQEGKLRGVIVPHAGYVYSGKVAAHAYALMKQFRDKKMKIILLGPAHYVYLDDVAADEHSAWETPLGTVKIAENDYPKSKSSHRKEHCLEVQVPFLQLILDKFEIIPLVAGDVNPKSVSKKIVKQWSDDSFLVISSDLSHFYDYNTANKLDSTTIKAIESLNYDNMEESGDACGKIPVLTAIDIAKQFGWRCRLLCRKNSGDVTGDKGNVVGYASFALYE
jgi:hypothetical protein